MNPISFELPRRGIHVVNDVPVRSRQPGAYYYANVTDNSEFSVQLVMSILRQLNYDWNRISFVGIPPVNYTIFDKPVTTSQRDQLASLNVNVIMTMESRGQVIWGNSLHGTNLIKTLPELVVIHGLTNWLSELGSHVYERFHYPEEYDFEVVKCYASNVVRHCLEELMFKRAIKNGDIFVQDGELLIYILPYVLNMYQPIQLRVPLVDTSGEAFDLANAEILEELNVFYGYGRKDV